MDPNQELLLWCKLTEHRGSNPLYGCSVLNPKLRERGQATSLVTRNMPVVGLGKVGIDHKNAGPNWGCSSMVKH